MAFNPIQSNRQDELFGAMNGIYKTGPQLSPEYYPRFCGMLNDLAVNLSDRYKRIGKIDKVVEAIKYV